MRGLLASDKSTELSATFKPERLGRPTAVSVALRIGRPADRLPPALSSVAVRFPRDTGLLTSGLGVATCSPAVLERDGGRACPANSKMGSGAATVAVAFGPTTIDERVVLGIYAAPSTDGFVHLAIVGEGSEPVAGRIVLSGVLLAGGLRFSVPPIASLPDVPGVAIVALRVTLGGPLTYHERSRGRFVAYHPQGIGLPSSCPRGGFVLRANLGFADGTTSSARATVPCPRPRGRR